MMLFILIILSLISCVKKKNTSTVHNGLSQQVKDTIISGIDFVLVPKGKFHYGSRDSLIDLQYDYWIMKHEVTNLQYYTFITTSLSNKTAFIKDNKVYYQWKNMPIFPDSILYIKLLDKAIYWLNDSLHLNPQYSSHPVTQVNWFGCMAYCNHKGFQLPDRYEWEKAARGLSGWYFPWGNEIDSTYANYYGSNHPYKGGTTPVGFFDGTIKNGFKTHNNASIYGCYDMAGNAYEYTLEFLCAPVGGGGGYHFHTAAMCAPHFQNCFGLPLPLDIQRSDTADGFRAIFK